jgi:pimeloyl-ACP methyl ester carboxylesterase
MEPFTCELANGGTATGSCSIPPRTATKGPASIPLIIAIHGGGYSSDYFHADANHTAAIPSQTYGIPFVAVDRPFYGGSTFDGPIPKAADYPQETGAWMHHHVLPALWARYGTGCSSVVLFCHSLGTQQGIVAAAMHAKETNPAYPLSGIIASGLGHRQPPAIAQAPRMVGNAGPDYCSQPVEWKDSMMFRPGTVDPAVLEQSARLDQLLPVAEANSLPEIWCPTWRETWAAQITVPVMYALVELECFFEGSQAHLKECAEAFTASPRVDGSFVRGAPHCMELSLWSKGWYARCFGFAMECAVTAPTRSKA